MTTCFTRLLLVISVVVSFTHAVLGGDRPETSVDPGSAKALVVFCAMGDVPRTLQEDVLLPKQIEELPKETDFVIHVGDIKSGGTPCDEAVFVRVTGMLAITPMPVFCIPGDNEWNDCENPDAAWTLWEKYLMRFDQRWKHDFRVFRQLEREENFSFVRDKVLFIGLNIVGGRVHDAAEWKRRLAEDLDWTRRCFARFGDEVGSVVIFGHAKPNPNHDDYFNGMVDVAQNFEKPVLYLHGDGHRWIHDRPFLAKNILRVQVDQGKIAPPLKVTVTDHPTEPFVFDRRKPASK